MSDFITVLTSKGPLLTKRWTSDGIEPYDRAKQFTAEAYQVSDIRGLSGVLAMLEEQPRRCAIRGRHLAHDDAGTKHEGGVETTRDLEHFTEAAHQWACLDVDGWVMPEGIDLDDPRSAVASFIQDCLPAEFQEITHHWQLSSSAGAPGKEHLLKAHIWFWLDEQHTGPELEAWARGLSLPVDITVFRTVQVHYTAAPVIDPGVSCPIGTRSGLTEGILGDEVSLVMPDVLELPRAERVGRAGMVDPRGKPGLIGAFCRAYPPHRVVTEVLPEVFEYEGDSDVRLTWLQGGGSPGGAVITDDELRIYNSHATDPFEGHAQNMWDLVRHFKFGDLDAGIDPEAVEWAGPSALPSHKAMTRWVRTLEDVEQEREEAAATEAEQAEARVQEALFLIRDTPTTAELERKTAPKLAASTWTDGERARLVKAMQDRFFAITNVRLPIADARRWLEPPAAGPMLSAGAPDWLSRWVYVTQEKMFFDLDRKVLVDARAFDALHTDKMPLRQGSATLREPASLYAVHAWGVRTVDYTMYAPPKPEVFSLDGGVWANTYDESTAPACEPGGETVIKMVESYLRRQFPDDRERGILLSWLAHNVRRPGVKVRWAPYVFGVEGAGKSFLAELLEWAMGGTNIKRIDGKTLTGDFTGWAAGKAVSVIEEVRQTGHFYDVPEALKAPITNDKINIHRKGLDDFEAPNFTNYLILSNHADGIPITETDRRYFFLKTAMGLEETRARSEEGYFSNLFDSCRDSPGQLRRWLMEEVQMHPDFVPNGRAPITSTRAMVIELVKSEPQLVIEDIVAGRDAVSATYVAAKLKAAGVDAKTRTLSGMLSRVGFEFSTRLRIDGDRHRIWIRVGRLNGSDESAVRAATSWMKLSEFAGMDDDAE
jgi:hypothetical protein